MIKSVALRALSKSSWKAPVFVLAFLTFGCSANAQLRPASHAEIELIADQGALQSSRPFSVGFLFRLEKGWHIYWQNPGDSGEPPHIEWALPAGLRADSIKWPRPIRLGSGTIIDYGYEDRVLLMAMIRALPGAAIPQNATIAAAVKYIVCREICVPGKASLTLAIPLVGGQLAHQPEWHAMFERARGQLPMPAPSSWKISAISDNDRFILSVKDNERRNVTFFPLEPSVIENSAPQRLVASPGGFELTLQKSEQLLKPISVLKGLIAFEGGPAYEVAAPVVRHSRESGR